MRKATVLFVCTGNSARSQMAEAMLRELAGDRFEVHSAGVAPKDIHPLTHRVLSELGIDTSSLRSKGLERFEAKINIHHAIIVCESAQRSCPRIFPFARETIYWPFEDPAAVEGSEQEKLAKFREVRDQIRERIQEWLAKVSQPQR